MIEAERVGRVFTVGRRRARRTVHAVRDLSFTIGAGEFVGCLGPNGAGKSTTIKMLTGILAPTSGRVEVAGLDPARHRTALARKIGVVFGQRTTLWWDLPLRDSFELVRLLYKVDQSVFRRRLEELTALLDLAAFMGTPVRQLSLGQRMRGDVTAALLHDPAVLVLDEPTIGLDVVSKAAMREFLRRLNAEHGTTVLLTTHDLGDIEKLCHRVMLIDHGRLTFDGTLDDLRATAPAAESIEDVVARLYTGEITPPPGAADPASGSGRRA
ncbi:ATP-binding cassette domain-containing protein [Streptosporangium sp. NPDC051022]|uniref:ABC transporter ATP-binding protein n=1 Tax=Streptosporangium sp. NPDC051022 TaxID=3155752 RepID=UPI0034149A05